MRNPNLVPLPEVQSPVVKMNLSLEGHVDPSMIGMDVATVEGICNFSGIDLLTVIGNSERSRSTPGIASTDRHGQATAAMGLATQEAQSFDTKLTNGEQIKSHQWFQAVLQINFPDLVQKVCETEGGLKSTEVWAQELDTEFKRLLLEAAQEVLNKEGESFIDGLGGNYLFSGGVGVLLITFLAALSGAHMPLEAYLLLPTVGVTGAHVAFKALNALVIQLLPKLSGRKTRLSLLGWNGSEMDRAWILQFSHFLRESMNHRLIDVIRPAK